MEPRVTSQAPEFAVSADRSVRRVVSAGTAGGVASGFDSHPAGAGLVRLGRDLFSLDEEDYRLWDVGLVAPSREAVLRQAEAAGLACPDQVLDNLAEGGLVIDWAAETGPAPELVNRYTVSFRGYLIGNGPYMSPRFLVRAGTGAPTLVTDVLVYQFLLRADGVTSVADQCDQLDRTGLPLGFDVLDHVVSRIPALLRAELIGLDLAGTADGTATEGRSAK
jgi:hypothetical protein